MGIDFRPIFFFFFTKIDFQCAFHLIAFQFSRSLSTGNAATSSVGGVSSSTTTVISADHYGPGSPYRSNTGGGVGGGLSAGISAGSLGSSSAVGGGGQGFVAKHSLSKELMQKLRSMTETIKMLSDENELLKRENDRIRDEEEGVYVVKQSKVLGHQNVGNVGVLPVASTVQKTSGETHWVRRCVIVTVGLVCRRLC